MQENKKAYECPKGEEHLYHCMIEQTQFNPATGERLSRPVLQKFGKKFFESFGAHNLKQQGYTITVLHDPNVKEETAEAAAEESQAVATVAQPKSKKK